EVVEEMRVVGDVAHAQRVRPHLRHRGPHVAGADSETGAGPPLPRRGPGGALDPIPTPVERVGWQRQPPALLDAVVLPPVHPYTPAGRSSVSATRNSGSSSSCRLPIAASSAWVPWMFADQRMMGRVNVTGAPSA